jgi:hypothetical protein
MKRFLAISVLFLSSVPAFAMPQFLEMYRSDPFRNPAVDGCNTCHMSPQGGDARNAFGQAFEAGGEVITPMLRAQFPDRFVYPSSKVSDALTIHFSDPGNRQVVVEAGGVKNLVDVDKRTVNGKPAATPNAPAVATLAASPAGPKASSEVPVDKDAREGAFFGSNVVNLPNGKPQKAGGVDFIIGHRFTQSVSDAGLGGFFGFDSSAIVAFGARVGLTDRLSVSVLRSNLFQTISLGSAFQVTRQSATMPITLQLRGGVDGKQNFGLYHIANNPQPRQYSPFIQVVTTRTFKDRVSLTAVPTFAFSTRDDSRGDNIPGNAFGYQYNNTISLGIGAGVRFLRTASVVGEYIPRLYGFRGENSDQPGVSTDRPGVSIGLQKSTFRHTFELVLSRQQPMTPAQYAVQGVNAFRIGFNIYRKIR